MFTSIKLFCVLILSSVIISGVFSSGVSQKIIAQNTSNNNKIAILTFGDGWKDQFTVVKPILDKYGMKASFFVTCTFVGLPFRMNWQDIVSLYSDGNDIGSKTMTYKDLTKLSPSGLTYEIGQSKQCLFDHGVNTTLFATPKGLGVGNTTVVHEIAKYYDLAINGFSTLMYLK